MKDLECKDIYEFLLWDNCNSNCSFCHQCVKRVVSNKEEKLQALNHTISFLNSDKYISGSHVLLVGGEIFDDFSIHSEMCTFLYLIINKMLTNEIDLLYINTNLLYTDLSTLFELLDTLQNRQLLHKLRFTTSYDLKGRFKTEDDSNLFYNNLIRLSNTYPTLRIVVNMILTEPMCEFIIKDPMFIKSFSNKYNVKVNLIPYIVLNTNLLASKEKIITTLQLVDETIPNYLEEYILNFDLKQNKLLYKYKDNELHFCSCEDAECGHSINFSKYSTDSSCYICDLKTLFM